MRLYRDKASLDDSAEAAAALIGDVDAETLIKDYWVTEALRVLAARHVDFFVFKGGTSLTKAIRCVDRFSEDIDILITGRPEGMSFDRLMKTMADDVAGTTGLAAERLSGTRNVSRAVKFVYGSRLENLYRPEVILEMGTRGTTTPGAITYAIRPMLADASPEAFDPEAYADLARFDVAVVHPARTLWEKVTLLHTDVASGKWREKEPTRFARHYGDIGALLGVDAVRTILEGSAMRAVIDAEVREVSARHFNVIPAAPDGGYAFSPAFRPDGEFEEFLNVSFESAVRSLWAPVSAPTLNGVFEAVDASKDLLDPAAG